MIDAYAHIGYPRYGTPDELVAVWNQWGIDKGCIALPPGMPDFQGLARARQLLGDRVRLFGIPYGGSPQDRTALAATQIEFGIAGMRLLPTEIEENPDVLALLGEAGLCLMAISVYESAEVTRRMLDWLDRYPGGTIAAPHFFTPASIDEGAADPAAFRELLRHPRMYAIFSRHGGASARPYPHVDLRPWVEEVLSLLTWKRALWGSEIPVIYHRDEQVDSVRGCLKAMGVGMGPEEEQAYLTDNAEGLFFAADAPDAGNGVRFPGWVEDGLRAFIAENGSVPVIRTRPLELPLGLHGALMSRYLVYQQDYPQTSFQQWLVGVLGTQFGVSGTAGGEA